MPTGSRMFEHSGSARQPELAEDVGGAVDEEVEVLEDGEDAELHGEARREQRLAPPGALGRVERPPDEVVDDRRELQQPEEAPVERAVEERAGDEHEPVLAAHAEAVVEAAATTSEERRRTASELKRHVRPSLRARRGILRLVSDVAYDPESHYDRVTDAWALLLGDDLHYGVFARATRRCPTATSALTALMIDAAQLEPGVEVLDVGCGTGRPGMPPAAEHGVAVTGITTSAVGRRRRPASAPARRACEQRRASSGATGWTTASPTRRSIASGCSSRRT